MRTIRMTTPLTAGKRQLLIALIMGSAESDLGIMDFEQPEIREGEKHLESLSDSDLVRIANEIMEEEA